MSYPSRRQYNEIHRRWISQLEQKLPDGVPLDAELATKGHPWPETFGDYDKETGALHGGPDGCCLQCLHCRFYVTLDGIMGMDWGACTNKVSQYDRQLVFEHWTCKEYRS